MFIFFNTSRVTLYYILVVCVQFFHLQKGTTVLFIAVGANALPMVKKLITKGALVNARRVGEHILHMVINPLSASGVFIRPHE